MAQDMRELPGSHRPPHHGMTRQGPAPSGDVATVSIYLAPRDEHEGAIASRAAIRDHRADAHADDRAAVRTFAEGAGLQVTHDDPARRLVQVTGDVAAIEKAFGTSLHHYEADGRVHRGREGSLHLPADVVDRVQAVLGLDTTPVATPKIVPHRGVLPPQGFLPTEIAALYGFADADATGQCIAIIELGGGYTDADNQAAFKAMGIPVPPIVAVGVDGGANTPTDGSGANGEVALDIQVAGGLARGAKLAVYFAPNTSQGFVDAITQAVHDDQNRPSAISISWGSPENGWSRQDVAAMSTAFADAAKLGVTVTAASGDSLATDGVKDGKAHVDFPASDPNVLGCGGTFVQASSAEVTSETVWNSNGGGTGGGISALFAPPAYQEGIRLPAKAPTGGGRGVPDVSGNGDPDSGYRIVTDGATGIVGGTSAVAPLWAAIAAVLNKARGKPIGMPHAALYGDPSALRDVIKGDNKSGKVGYDAAPGWDACTGLGSPDGARLRKLFGA